MNNVSEHETATMTTLRNRIDNEAMKREKYIDAHSILSSDRKSKFVSCQSCGSRLNRTLLKKEKCPVCGADLRSRTTIETIDRYNGNIKRWTKEYRELDKKHYEQQMKNRFVRYEGFFPGRNRDTEEYRYVTKDEMIDFLKRTKKPFRYTYGIEYRNPTTNGKPLTRKEAVSMFKRTGMDVTERETYIDMNDYSDNDMW